MIQPIISPIHESLCLLYRPLKQQTPSYQALPKTGKPSTDLYTKNPHLVEAWYYPRTYLTASRAVGRFLQFDIFLKYKARKFERAAWTRKLTRRACTKAPSRLATWPFEQRYQHKTACTVGIYYRRYRFYRVVTSHFRVGEVHGRLGWRLGRYLLTHSQRKSLTHELWWGLPHPHPSPALIRLPRDHTEIWFSPHLR